MTSGIPFSKEEIAYIRAHSPHEFPSIIARALAIKFREHNKGTRNPKAVKVLMKRLEMQDLMQDLEEPIEETEPATKQRRKKPAKIP